MASQVIDYVTKAGKVSPKVEGRVVLALIGRFFHVSRRNLQGFRVFHGQDGGAGQLSIIPPVEAVQFPSPSTVAAVPLSLSTAKSAFRYGYFARLIALGPYQPGPKTPPPLAGARPADLFMGLFGVRVHSSDLRLHRLGAAQPPDPAQRGRPRERRLFLADHTARLLEVTDLTLKQTITLVQGRTGTRSKPRGRSGSRSMRSRIPCPISRTLAQRPERPASPDIGAVPALPLRRVRARRLQRSDERR